MSWAQRDTTLQKKQHFYLHSPTNKKSLSYSDPEGTLEKIRTLIQP